MSAGDRIYADIMEHEFVKDVALVLKEFTQEEVDAGEAIQQILYEYENKIGDIE